MNRHLFRVVFNRARGLRMAVQESASGGRGRAGMGNTRARSLAFKPLAAALALLYAQYLAHQGTPT